MNFDIDLTSKCNPNTAFFRLYRWQPFCISLGANQRIADIDERKTTIDGIDIVKRPTGGRAILHAEELTYSAILPLSYNLTPREIYEKISISLIKGLTDYNQVFSELELENLQPNFSELLKQPTGVLCFGSTAKNEVKFNGKKIIGSAQRKLDKVILQHGSILCGTYHRKLIEYINSDNSNKELFTKELLEKTTEIETVTGTPVNYDSLINSIIEGFKKEWQIEFESVIKGNSF